MSVFLMELNDYPHFYLADDRGLRPTGQHCPRFPRVLYDALIRLGYNGDLQSTVANCTEFTT
jgi:hypothetical protein